MSWRKGKVMGWRVQGRRRPLLGSTGTTPAAVVGTSDSFHLLHEAEGTVHQVSRRRAEETVGRLEV